MDEKQTKVLLIDDNPGDARMIRELLGEVGGSPFRVECADRLSGGLERLAGGEIEVVLLDLGLPDSWGFETFSKVNAHTSDVPIVVMSGLGDEAVAVEAVRAGAQDYLVKGQFDSNLLARAIHYAIERKRAGAELKRLHAEALEANRALQQALDDLRQAQARMIQTEKLSALGQLIAGVAHELNNPLAVISGFAELWVRSEKTEPAVRERAGKILEHTRRCERIVQNLRSFAREHRPARVPVSVNEPLGRVMELRAHQLTLDRIQVELRLAENLPPVYADPHQLEQVFLNLVNNVQDALIAKEGERRLTIETGASDGWIWVRVSDTGIGIRREHLDRIFDPFFTTKEIGKGTGLGLSVVIGIVKEHGGEVAVESEEGVGTTFSVTLPTGDRQASPVVHPPGRMPAEQLRGRSILVIDDEPDLLEALREGIEACGARVATARDGEEGLRRVGEESFDAILCDVRMPRMNGAQFLERLREVRPKLVRRVVFMTGSDLQQMRLAPSVLAGHPMVDKPVELEKLVGLLASVCGGRVVA